MTTATTAITLSVINGQPTTTSHDVAAIFNRRHAHVLDSIKSLLLNPEINEPTFRLVEYTDAKGEIHDGYTLNRDGFALLCMGFTGKRALKFKLAFIAEFNRMEAALQNPAPVETINLAQQQTIKELVILVHETTGQSYGEVYSRLHNKLHIPRYQDMHPRDFVEACEYLRGKMDGNMIMKLVTQHIGTPRMLMSFDHEGRQVIKFLRDDDVVMPYSAIPSRIESGEIPANVVKSIASQALNRMTGGQLSVI